MTITTNPPTITDITSGFDTVIEMLEANQGQMVRSDNPFINQQLKQLLGNLYETQHEAGVLVRPIVLDISKMSTADLISILITETRRTKDLVATSTVFEIKQNDKRVQANNQKVMDKLKQAKDSADEAQKISNGLGIFKWIALALSIILTICSIIATVCTFGAAWPTIAASVIVLSTSVALTIATSVPVDDEEHSAMDLMSVKLAEAISQAAKKEIIADLRKKGIDWDKLTLDEQQEYLTEAEETGTYSALAIIIAIQIMIAVVMIAMTAGAGSGSAASNVANSATSATKSAVAQALNAAKTAISNNVSTIMQATKNISYSLSILKGLGQLTATGFGIEGTLLRQEADDATVDANLAKAYSLWLSKKNEQMIDLIQQLFAEIAGSYEEVASVLKTQHQTNMKINTVMGAGLV